ncbi:type II secretion system minor pseudopilin GspJ [Ruegeria marina]|uniref:Type II secretion system protein J n=1 Tax=Ruegeria marina TaxID=639004 RepID=A0A1G7CFJ6_9RHOB|nr:type II secretion system minor pseudopilin GspJ [Ruegeria marina]SDE37476.1 general secretion pathway protein J [Ruegeria marina]
MRRDAGLTLIELVIAMALFAFVAVMSLSVLNGTLRAQDRYREVEARTAEASLALTLLRRDLAHAVPASFVQPGGVEFSSLEMIDPGPVLRLSLAGQPSMGEPGDDGMRRVEWRFDRSRGALLRRVWPTLTPAQPGQVSPETTMLTGVERLHLRVYSDGQGWLDWTELPENQIVLALPDAVEVTVTLEGYGPVPLVEVYR